MPLTAGDRLGPYEVSGRLGEGGMGEVYRAHDTKLGRDVALKILPAAFAANPDRLMRFEREARALAALNHPNIAQIYGLEHSAASPCIVMELVEGETLADRLIRRVSVDEAIEIGAQIADALDAAHAKGIVHRDLKPANVVVGGSHVKVLDFGLAKLFQPDTAAAGVSDAPTMIAPTGGLVLLGTAPYMSPEQARGREVDQLTDMWALGCVLYEMLAGRRAFSGDTTTDILGAIVKGEPDWSALPPDTPPRVLWLIRRCLEKHPKERLHQAADVRIVLQDRTLDPPGTVAVRRQARPARTAAIMAGALIAAALGAGAAMLAFRSADPPRVAAVIRLAIDPPAAAPFPTVGPFMAISPDGRHLAYSYANQLWLRSLNSLESRPLATVGVGGGGGEDVFPFFSADGRWIGFAADGRLKKIAITGGAALELADAATIRGGSWGADDTIYYVPSNASGVWRIPGSGGTPEQVTTLDRAAGEVSHRWPQVLPGGKAVLFTTWAGPARDERHVHVLMLETGERRVVIEGADHGRYMAPGLVVYAQENRLMAVPVDPDTFRTTGAAQPLDDYVARGGEGGRFALSDSGSLAYVPADPNPSSPRLVWVDRAGTVSPIIDSQANRRYTNPALSPDERFAAIEMAEGTLTIWIHDLTRGTLTRLTSGASSQTPAWTPDGTRITYRGTRQGTRNLFWKAADGSGDEERLTTSDYLQTPGSWSPAGTWLAFHETHPRTGNDIWMLPIAGDRTPQLFLRTPAHEAYARFSPDGRWVAYESNESGRAEIYVRPFPGINPKYTVTTDGGTEPLWSRDGRELFYLRGDTIMAVRVNGRDASFSAGIPRRLYAGRFQRGSGTVTGYDVTRDGRFLRVQPTGPDEDAARLHVVVNWMAEVWRRLQ